METAGTEDAQAVSRGADSGGRLSNRVNIGPNRKNYGD